MTLGTSPTCRTFDLKLVQPLIKPSPSQQFRMGALFPELAMVKHQDLVGVEDRAQPVRHHQAGPTGHEFADRSLNQRLRLGID